MPSLTSGCSHPHESSLPFVGSKKPWNKPLGLSQFPPSSQNFLLSIFRHLHLYGKRKENSWEQRTPFWNLDKNPSQIDRRAQNHTRPRHPTMGSSSVTFLWRFAVERATEIWMYEGWDDTMVWAEGFLKFEADILELNLWFLKHLKQGRGYLKPKNSPPST